jgi:predicted RNase H-like HicB family nuclease
MCCLLSLYIMLVSSEDFWHSSIVHPPVTEGSRGRASGEKTSVCYNNVRDVYSAKAANMQTLVTLEDYQEAAMRQAAYETLPDGTIRGKIPALPGVWASAPTLATCRDELRAVLEGWMLQRLTDDLDLPSLNGVTPMISTAYCPWHPGR